MKISENTTLSIGVVVALLGGAAWLTALWDEGKANSHAIEELNHSRSAEWRAIQEIREIVIRIEERLKR